MLGKLCKVRMGEAEQEVKKANHHFSLLKHVGVDAANTILRPAKTLAETSLARLKKVSEVMKKLMAVAKKT